MASVDVILKESRLRPEQLRGFVRAFSDELAVKHGRARRMLRDGNGSFDLLAWGRKHLEEHFSREPSNMHRWLAEQLAAMRFARGTKINVLGPRGGAKSTIGTLAYPLWAAVECWEPYIWIVSDTKHQACAHLENIKCELLENRVLAAAYPQAAGRGLVWRNNTIVLRNGVTIEAFGTGQRIRGRRRRSHRPTLIICDDLQNDGHILSALQRERSREWFHGTLMKAGTARTNVINLATALHHDALAMELHRSPGWTSRLFKAIQRWPENASLWQQWEAIYCDLANPRSKQRAAEYYERNRSAMNAGAILLWPEEEDLYTLMRMRVDGGRTAFEREKQNSPINPELCEWPETYFDESIWFHHWPKDLAVKTLALDPSKGNDSRRGDFSALVMLGVDRRGMLYVEADLARRPTPQIVADGVEIYRSFRPDVFGIESNQFQNLLAGEFEAEFRRQGLLGASPFPMENNVNKLVRIRRLGPYLSSRRILFRGDSPSTRLLVEQLRQFPVGDHDDGPDALEMAIRLAAGLLQGRAAADGLGNRLPVG
jgi:predicted phage terminase large subunit-like protein